MKIPVSLLIAPLLFILACNKAGEKNDFWYDFDGKATLEINYSVSKEQVCSIFMYKMFPEEEIRITDTIPSGSGTKTYELPVSWPQKVTFSASGQSITLMVLPGSTLSCNIDFSDLKKTTFATQDSLRFVNEYLLTTYPKLTSLRSQKVVAANSSSYLPELANTLDEIYVEEQQILGQNTNKLPHWFRDYEYWDNLYSDAALRMNSVIQRAYSSGKDEQIPTTYYDFLKTIKLNNGAAKNSYSYYLFLYELFNKGLKEASDVDCNYQEFLSYHLCRADKELTGDVKDLFKAFTIQNVYNYYKKDVARKYLKTTDSIFSDTVWKSQLSAYFIGKEKLVAKDALAPNFVLADLKDSLISLRSLKGNVVVLSFWFAGCKPCIEEFPAENELVEKFKGKPVKIVSVCVNTTEEQWRRSSKKYNLKTIDLWANSAWEKTIIEKYNLYGFPRYVLIDQNQKLSNANAERPSQGLEAQINALFDQ